MVASKREFIRGLHNVRAEHYGSVVTIGSFDGVHLGHQVVLQQVQTQAELLRLPSVVMIFEPQPHEFFSGEKAPARLMCLKEKVQALFDEGIDRVCCLPFNGTLRGQSADDFVKKVLVDGLGTQYMVVGDDFRFGADRSGDYKYLEDAGKLYGFDVTDTESFLVDDERVSSTRIRRLLQEDDFAKAAQLLDKPYSISGRVVKGQQLGRQLGTPTANVHLHRYRSPLTGVFAVSVVLPSGDIARGVANVGVRPTLGGDAKPLLEVHLFDRNDNLYGYDISVEFKAKLRDEKRFEGLEQLKQQIQQDIHQARQFFS